MLSTFEFWSKFTKCWLCAFVFLRCASMSSSAADPTAQPDGGARSATTPDNLVEEHPAVRNRL